MSLKQINKSVVQLRAEKEGNAFMLKSTTPGDMFQATKSKAQLPSAGPVQKEAKTPLLDTSHASRVMSSEGMMKETKRKTNYEIFFDILSYRLLSDFSKELAVIKFNNDTLTAIISSIDRLDPSVGACLIQELLNRVLCTLLKIHRRKTLSIIACSRSMTRRFCTPRSC